MNKRILFGLCILGLVGLLGCQNAASDVITENSQIVSFNNIKADIEVADADTEVSNIWNSANTVLAGSTQSDQSTGIKDKDGKIYATKEAFLEAYGFGEATPFYEYSDEEGNPEIVLYFDEEEENGCGILFKDGIGFLVNSLSEVNYDKPMNVPIVTVSDDDSKYYYIYRGYGDEPKYRLLLIKNEDEYVANLTQYVMPYEIEGELSVEEAMEAEQPFPVYNATGAYGIPADEPIWYTDEQSFLAKFEFDDKAPLIDYYDAEGEHQITVYYDRSQDLGCSILTEWNGNRKGYIFKCRDKKDWTGYGIDYNALTTLDGYNPKDGAETMEGYEEKIEYDEQGRIVFFESSAISDISGLEGARERILTIEFEYYDNGNIKYRRYSANHLMFATTGSPTESYFDEQGRLVYEWAYITHGSLHDYYVYEGDSKEPSYILRLDDNHDWIYHWEIVK